MAECDQDIQKGSSTELTQLVKERQVNISLGRIYDITAMPDGNFAVVYARPRRVSCAVVDGTTLITMSENEIVNSPYESDLECKSATTVSLCSNGVMVASVRRGSFRSQHGTKRSEITELVKSRHAINGRILLTASSCSVKEYEFDVACAKSDELFIMFLTTTPPQLEIEDLSTGLSEHVQLASFNTQFLSIFDRPHMSLDNSDGQTFVFISAMVGFGNRVVTKLNLKGDILATLVDPSASIPGPIAAVGDGTQLFNYGDNICLLSDKCKIVATLGSVGSNLRSMCFKRTSKGLRLYCLGDLNILTEYSCA